MGPERINMEAVPAGNIVAVTGLRDAMPEKRLQRNRSNHLKPFTMLANP